MTIKPGGPSSDSSRGSFEVMNFSMDEYFGTLDSFNYFQVVYWVIQVVLIAIPLLCYLKLKRF